MSAAETPGEALVRASSTGSPETSLRIRTRSGRLPVVTGDVPAMVAALDAALRATLRAAPHAVPGAAPCVPPVAARERLHDRQVRGLRFTVAAWSTPEAPRVVRLRHSPTRPAGPARPAGPVRRVWRELTFCAAVALAGRHVHADLVVAITPSPGGAAGVDPAHLHLLPPWTRPGPPAPSRLEARAARSRARHHADQGPVSRGLSDGDQRVRAAAVDVVLAGDGPRRTALQQQAFGLANVRFADVPDIATQALVLAAADVLLVADPGGPGAADPGQLPAYLAAGRPVLAAAPASSAVAYELRRAGEAGRRVDPADPAALAEAMITLHTAPRQRALMGRAALRYARTHLGRAAALRRLELVVDAALPGRTQEVGR